MRPSEDSAYGLIVRVSSRLMKKDAEEEEAVAEEEEAVAMEVAPAEAEEEEGEKKKKRLIAGLELIETIFLVFTPKESRVRVVHHSASVPL